MNLLRLCLMGIIALSFTSLVSAWGAYIPTTYNSNELFMGTVYNGNQYHGFNYYAYAPGLPYRTLGGGSYYPYGYHSGSYFVPTYNYPVYNGYYPNYGGGYYGSYGSYYNMPYNAPTSTLSASLSYHNGGLSVKCTATICYP